MTDQIWTFCPYCFGRTWHAYERKENKSKVYRCETVRDGKRCTHVIAKGKEK